jgi:hypothetical protein
MKHRLFPALWLLAFFLTLCGAQEVVEGVTDAAGTVTIPTLLNRAFEMVIDGDPGTKVTVTYRLQIDGVSPDGPVDFAANVHGVRGRVEGEGADADAPTTFIYRMQLMRNGTDVTAYLPVRITLSRGDSVYENILRACPEYREQKLCSLIANHVSRAYYGVEYAPRHPAATVEDFTASRTTVLQYLARRYGYRRYLEVGCEYEENFKHLRCVVASVVFPWATHGSL